MADQRKIAAGVDLLLGQRAPAASEQEDEAKIKAGAQLLLGGNQPSKTQAVIPAATPPGVPYDPDFADFVGASAESFGVGLGDSLFAAKRGFYNLTLDFILDHTDAGKELVRMSRSPREAVKEALIQNAEALPRALPSTAAVLKIEDYLTDKLKRDLASRPTEVQENLAVQVSGAMGQITGTAAQAAIPGVGVGLAMTSGAAQGFNEVYEEARQKGATMGDAVVGALPSAAAAAVLEPLGARAATSVGKVFNRWNQRSGGAVERILDDLSKRAGTEAAKRVTGKAGEELIEVSMDKIFADAATAGLKRVPGGKALTGATGQAFGRIGRAGAVEFFGEGMEKVLANAGVNYATEQDVSLLRGVVDEGIVGGSAGALIRSVVETIVGIRARRGAGTIINISPKVGDTPLYNEDGTPIKMSEVMSGMTPEEMATKETQVVADAAASYRDQIIASRGQKDSPRYIPETVSTRELAIVISNERKIDMALATQAAERAKSMVAERLAREPLEPVFEPKVDPTNPMTWSGLTEEQATAAYNEEYSEYLAQLEKFNQRLEKQRAVAQEFGADYLGGVDDLDELRLQASNENARFWSEMYGDPERGVSTKRGPKGEEVAIPRTTVAKLQTTWQELFNEEYALELMEADVKRRGQVDFATQRRNQDAIEQARANIEAYKQILAEEYRRFPTINRLYESGVERNVWKSYLQKQRELDPTRAAIQAELLRNQNKSQVSPEERLKSRQQKIEADAKKRAEDVKRAEEAQAELLEQFPGGKPTPERKADLDELKRFIRRSYRKQKRVRTEEEQAEYDAFEAALPGLLNDFNAAKSNAEQARAELKGLEDDIYALRKDIEKAVSDRQLSTARKLKAELDEKNGLLDQKKKQAVQADLRLREARDRLATYEAKPEEPPEAPPEAPPQPPQPPSKPPTKPPAAPAAPAAPAPAAPAAPAVAPTPQVQAAPAAAAAKPSVVLEFKTGPQKEAWLEVYVRIQDLPDNEDIIEQYGQDVIDELVALDDAANSISVSNKAADLLRELFDDQRAMTEGAIQSKIYEHGTDNSGKPVTRQKIESQYKIYEKYLEQLDSALEEQAGQYAEEPTPAPVAAPTTAPEKSVLPTAASVTVAPSAPPRIASFFSGMGTVEAMLGKVSHVLAVEHEQDIVDAYNEAHGTKFQSASVFDINIDDVKDANPDLFHASPVCKEFSVAKFGQRNPDVDEVRSAQQIAKVIREVQPPAVTIENVPGYNDFPPFQNIVSALKEAGYKYRILIVDAADYGAAQRRERLIVQAVRSGELPPVPEKTGPADWYEQTKDLLASAEESPMGPDELARIKSMIQKGTLDGTKPIITMGGSAFKGKANASNSGGPAPTLPASPNQVVRVLFPDGRTVRVPSRALARLQGLPDLLTLPARATTAKKVLGNGVHGVITEKFIRPLLPASGKPAISPEPLSQIDAQVRAMLNPDSTKKFVFVAEGSPQPTQSLVTGPVKVYAVKLTGAKGGMRGTLYTTDLRLSMSARARAQREGGVTEQQLGEFLYNRSQGKPKDPVVEELI
jgi:site-specific DNA-cytosine methylase